MVVELILAAVTPVLTCTVTPVESYAAAARALFPATRWTMTIEGANDGRPQIRIDDGLTGLRFSSEHSTMREGREESPAILVPYRGGVAALRITVDPSSNARPIRRGHMLSATYVVAGPGGRGHFDAVGTCAEIVWEEN